MSYLEENHYSTQQNLDAAWDAFATGDVGALFKLLARMTGRSFRSLSSERKVAKCLLAYEYPALQQVTESVRREFALASAWKYSSSWFPVEREWDKADEPLAAILGTGYILDMDIEAMCREIYGKGYYIDDKILPVPYGQRAELWPELASLPTLSLAARKIYVRAMQRFQVRSGFVEYHSQFGLGDSLPSTPEFDDGLIELAEVGLIDLDPSPTDLLMNFPLKDLKQCAFKHGVESHGPKYRLVQAIVTQIGQEEIESLLGSLDTGIWYIRPLVGNLSLLKKYVWAEIHRIELYLEWIQHAHCLHLAPPEYSETPPSRDNTELWFDPDPEIDRRTRTEIQLAAEIWDSKCEEIVLELADKYAWDAPLYISDAIAAYLPSDLLEAFKQVCEEHETHVWHNVLMYYGQARLAELGIKTRETRLLECAGCGRLFREWLVPESIAMRVGYKIHFCNDCYRRVFWSDDHRAEPVSMRQDDMLNRLAELAAALESVPLATFFRQPDLAAVSGEKQIAIVQALLAMPSYKAYVDTFGSWLKALVLAGILEDGTQRTQRGIRCIAADGHECLSLAERVIDDWLSAHNIPHEIEPLYPYHFHLNPAGRMRADWKVGEVLIEYAGLMDEPEYAAKMETKQELAAKFDLSLIIIEPKDILSLDKKLSRLVALQ